MYTLGGGEDVEPVSHHVTVTFADLGGKTRIDMRRLEAYLAETTPR